MSDDWDERAPRLHEIRSGRYRRDEVLAMNWWAFFLGMVVGAVVAASVCTEFHVLS